MSYNYEDQGERKMQIKNPHPYGPLDQRRLAALESEIGLPFPAEYRDFLVQSNGGDFIERVFHISDAEGDSSVHNVYGLHEGPHWLQLDELRKTFSDRIPSYLLPIAADPGGNQICIALFGTNTGCIFFFDHASGRVFRLAGSLQQFLNSLHASIPEGELERILLDDDVDALKGRIERGFHIETRDDHGRTLLEQAAIQGRLRLIEFLVSTGAAFGRSLELARENARFFEDHKPVVELLERLQQH